MPNWKGLLDELKALGGPHDVIRRKYLANLSEATGRNLIAYYSGWLQKGGMPQAQGIGFELNDSDKNGFMTTIHGLDRAKGLDLVLHTPGGQVAALESLVDYLRQMFGKNIRAIVPQLAMSAGTMLALSCKEIVMGKHSSLGPIDPQVSGLAAHGVIEEFDRARSEVSTNPNMANIWIPILQKYSPTLIGECQKAIQWAENVVRDWLMTGMFEGDADAKTKVDRVIAELGDHALTLSHERHISIDKVRELGLKVIVLEDDDDLQEHVLSVHHAFVQTLSETGAFKIIENQNGVTFAQQIQRVILQSQ